MCRYLTNKTKSHAPAHKRFVTISYFDDAVLHYRSLVQESGSNVKGESVVLQL